MFGVVNFVLSDPGQIFLIATASCALLFSIICFGLNRIKPALVLLMVFGAAAFLSAAFFDPFLNLWDERFHVLVAKNMLDHPFVPMLYNDFNFTSEIGDWSTHSIWLHKQPWFMWQMALSMKIFGAHEWAARLPDVLLGVCLIPVFFRTGKLLQSEQTGYLAAFCFATTGFLPELISGRQMLDHNDFVFIAYVSLSVWSYVEYYFSQKRLWLFWIGLFAGLAILCKWLPGLFVYLIWSLILMMQRDHLFSETRKFAVAFVITLVVVLPWQLYIFYFFPDVAKAEYAMNARHFFEVIEGHDGPPGYHFMQIGLIYGRGMLWLLILALIWFIFKKDKQLIRRALVISVAFVYVFFSLAKTKMPAFTAVAIMPVLLILASFIDFLFMRIRMNRFRFLYAVTTSCLLLALAIWRIDPASIAARHGMTDTPEGYWLSMKHNATLWRNIQLPPNSVLFNAGHGTYIECMFYTGRPAFDFLPEEHHLQELNDKGLVAVILDADNFTPPEFYAGFNLICDQNSLMKEY